MRTIRTGTCGSDTASTSALVAVPRRPDGEGGYEHAWCFPRDPALVERAVGEWDPDTQGEPMGWHKRRTVQRGRRPSGGGRRTAVRRAEVRQAIKRAFCGDEPNDLPGIATSSDRTQQTAPNRSARRASPSPGLRRTY